VVFQIVVEASCIDVVDSLLEVNICNFWFLKRDVNRLPTIYNRSPLTRCLFKMMPNSARCDLDVLVGALSRKVER
jgi:hypothetical protein